MLKQFSSEALSGWVGVDTWFTGHFYDEERFYKFVDAYSKEHGFSVDERALFEEILRRIGLKIGESERLEKCARENISLMVNILEFLQVTGR